MKENHLLSTFTFLKPKTQDQKLNPWFDEERVMVATRLRRKNNNSLATFPYIARLT